MTLNFIKKLFFKYLNHLKISQNLLDTYFRSIFSKYIEKKCNFLNVIFRNFEFCIYFAPPLHEVEKNTISDFNWTTDSVKSKRVSGDTLTDTD